MRKYVMAAFMAGVLWADNNAADFLQTGLSARSLALGNAVTATGGHLDTAFRNPAALQDVEAEIFSAAVNNFEMVDNKMLGLAGKIWPGRKPLIVGLIYANSEVNGISRTSLDADGRPIEDGKFASLKHNGTLVLSYRENRNLWYGLGLRRYFYSLSDATATTTGVDVGFRRQMPDWQGNQFFVGASLKNIMRTRISWSTGHQDTMPFGINFGLAAQRKIFGHNLLASWDTKWQENMPLNFSAGLEYDLNFLALRAGWDERLAYGIGLRYFGLNLDYAQTLHEELGLQQRVSVLLVL